MQGLEALTLWAVRNPSITYSQPSLYSVLHIWGSSASLDSTNWRWYGTAIFTIAQLKPVLIKGQLYFPTQSVRPPLLLITKLDEDIARKENYRSVSLMNINANILNLILAY